jgi:hypothetical protein
VEGAAPPAKCPWEKSVTDVYENKFKSDKTAACKAIAEHVAAEDLTAAELGINQLLVALFNDTAVCTQDLDACPFKDGPEFDPASVVAFAQATCDIAPGLPLDVDCVVPLPENFGDPSPPTNPTAGIEAGWIAAGPVGEGATVVLPNGEFGIQIDDLEARVTEVFVTIRENPPTPNPGDCPLGDVNNGNSRDECVQNNYTVDMDGVGEPYNENDPIADGDPVDPVTFPPGLYVEICEGEEAPFAPVSVPARCSGGACAPAQAVNPPRGLLQCSKGAVAFAPSTWSAVVDDLRDVQCIVTSTSAAVSEGTTCTVINVETNLPVEGKSCPTTEVTTQKTAQCPEPIRDLLAADPDDGSAVSYRMEATKIESGVSHFGSTEFTLSQTDPLFGDVKPITVDVLPSGQQ